MMAQEKQQANKGGSPKLAIDCMLANVGSHIEADGCVLEFSETGYTRITPDRMRGGDFVKVRLWVEDEEAFVDIHLAEVKKVYKHWIKVEVIHVSQTDRLRLNRCIDTPAAMHIREPSLTDHLLIRA
jgi:hypothetical protein